MYQKMQACEHATGGGQSKGEGDGMGQRERLIHGLEGKTQKGKKNVISHGPAKPHVCLVHSWVATLHPRHTPIPGEVKAAVSGGLAPVPRAAEQADERKGSAMEA